MLGHNKPLTIVTFNVSRVSFALNCAEILGHYNVREFETMSVGHCETTIEIFHILFFNIVLHSFRGCHSFGKLGF